jgi:hypothetical protein
MATPVDYSSICSNPEPTAIFMNLEDEFPARYWINLGRRQDRRAETEWQLHQTGITAERFPAVDARFVRKNRGYESAGRYALALSQRLAIRKAMLAGAKAVLILEDDVIFHPDLARRLETIELPEDWGIFYLGCAHQKRPWKAGNGLVRTRYALDTHAFAVRAPYYKQVIAALDASTRANRNKSHPRASDWYLANLHEKIPTYACFPNLAWQAMASSDLAGGTYSNYTSTGEQVSSAGEVIGLGVEMAGGKRWKQPLTVVSDLPDSEQTIATASPKLALMFLTKGGLNQPDAWRAWLDQASGDVTAYAHIKSISDASDDWFRDLQIREVIETKWGDISLVRAMMALLREALLNPQTTHFAFVSESCIPIKSWQEIRNRLRTDGRSQFHCVGQAEMKEKHLERFDAVPWVEARCRKIHSQWVMLNREAAQCLIEDDFTTAFETMTAPDEHYIGSVLAMKGYPLDDSKLYSKDITWVRWQDNPEQRIAPEWITTVNTALQREWMDFPGFFARKISPMAKIANLLDQSQHE